MKKSKYKLEVTTKQLQIIEEALDQYTRVGIAQLEIVAENIVRFFPDNGLNYWGLRENCFDPIKQKLFGYGSGASHGIGSPKVSDRAKIGYDLQKTIQKALAEEEKHHESSVWHHGNILHLGSEPVAKCSPVYNGRLPKCFPDEAPKLKSKRKKNAKK